MALTQQALLCHILSGGFFFPSLGFAASCLSVTVDTTEILTDLDLLITPTERSANIILRRTRTLQNMDVWERQIFAGEGVEEGEGRLVGQRLVWVDPLVLPPPLGGRGLPVERDKQALCIRLEALEQKSTG